MIVDGRVMRLNYTDVAVTGCSIRKVKVPRLPLYCQLVEGSLRVKFSDISDVVVLGQDHLQGCENWAIMLSRRFSLGEGREMATNCYSISV